MAYSAESTTVVLLAAGHGKRMLPLTRTIPKPLLKVGQHSLIEHHLLALAKLGFRNVVINLAHLGEKIRAELGDGSRFGLNISYSDESKTGALETAGGLKNALPLIDSDPFLVINADIWTDCNFTILLDKLHCSARLLMIANPIHNQNGDFSLEMHEKDASGSTALPGKSMRGVLTHKEHGQNSHTFSGIALYRKAIFTETDEGVLALAPILKSLIKEKHIEGLSYTGEWRDIGTPQRLEELNQQLNFSDTL